MLQLQIGQYTLLNYFSTRIVVDALLFYSFFVIYNLALARYSNPKLNP